MLATKTNNTWRKLRVSDFQWYKGLGVETCSAAQQMTSWSLLILRYQMKTRLLLANKVIHNNSYVKAKIPTYIPTPCFLAGVSIRKRRNYLCLWKLPMSGTPPLHIDPRHRIRINTFQEGISTPLNLKYPRADYHPPKSGYR